VAPHFSLDHFNGKTRSWRSLEKRRKEKFSKRETSGKDRFEEGKRTERRRRGREM